MAGAEPPLRGSWEQPAGEVWLRYALMASRFTWTPAELVQNMPQLRQFGESLLTLPYDRERIVLRGLGV